MARLTVDFRYIEVEGELWALKQMLDTIEPTIARLASEEETRTWSELRENGLNQDEGEVALVLQELSEKVEVVLPRFFRGPFVVALWACFESGLAQVATTRQREKKVRLGLRDLRGSPLPQARRYFEEVLEVTLDKDQLRLKRLDNLYTVRNALAHANGQQDAMEKEAWARVEKILSNQSVPLNDPRGLIVLTEAFVKSAYEDVNACLRDLIARLR